MAVEDLRKLEHLIRASDEVNDDDDNDHDEELDDPMNYKYEILGHTEADWDPLELQLSPEKNSSVSTIEQLTRLAKEESEQSQQSQSATGEKLGWPEPLQVRNVLYALGDWIVMG